MTVIKTLAVAGLLLAMMFSPSYCFPPFEGGQNAQLATVPNSERDVDEEGMLAIVYRYPNAQFCTNYYSVGLTTSLYYITGILQFFGGMDGGDVNEQLVDIEGKCS